MQVFYTKLVKIFCNIITKESVFIKNSIYVKNNPE